MLVALVLPLLLFLASPTEILKLGFGELVARFSDYDFGLLIYIYCVWAAALALEVVLLPFSKTTLSRAMRLETSTRIDLMCLAIYDIVTVGVVVAVFTLGFSYVLRTAIENLTAFRIAEFPDNPIIAFVCFVVLIDLVDYWRHRLSHRWGFWWEAHKYHHSATEMNVFTAIRKHPLDHGVGYIVFALPVALIGAPAEFIIPLAFVRSFVIQFSHTNADVDYGWAGYVFVSPNFHRTHHIRSERLANKNYSYVFSFWDRLFGTWHPPTRPHDDIRYGVNGFDASETGFLAGWARMTAKVANRLSEDLRRS